MNDQIHMVHYKEEYGSVGNAMTRRDGLAVLGIPLSSVRGDRNTLLEDLVYSLNQLRGLGELKAGYL